MSKPIKVDSAALAAELAWLTKSKTRGLIPALHAVEIASVVGALRLRYTDLDLFRESVLPGGGGGQASILVDPAKLASLIRGAYGFALVDVTDTTLAITVDGRTIKLKASADHDDYPAWPMFVAGDSGAALVTGGQLTRVLTSVGVDPTLPFLTVVRFEDAAMVSTDRFRLSRVAYIAHGKPMDALVPGEALRAFAGSADMVTVDHGQLGSGGAPGSAVHVSSGERSIIARTVDCEFPKWRQLIPAEDTVPLIVVIRRDGLLDAIGPGDNVELTVNRESIVVCSTDRDRCAEVEQQIGIVRLIRDGGLPFTVRIGRKNLTECLKGIAAGAVKFLASTPTRPVVLEGVGGGDLHLIMPLRGPDGGADDKTDDKTDDKKEA